MNTGEGEIIIRIVEQGGYGGVDKANAQTVNNKPSNKVNVKKDGDVKTALKTQLILSALGQASAMAKSELNYQLNKYFKQTDNYLGQQQKDIALHIVSKVKRSATTIIGGAIAGGPIGAVIGATVDVARNVQEYYHAHDQEIMRIQQMNVSLSFNRQRAGFSLTSGVTGENK